MNEIYLQDRLKAVLETKGFKIYHNPFYIDILAEKDQKFYAFEVKTRNGDYRMAIGQALENMYYVNYSYMLIDKRNFDEQSKYLQGICQNLPIGLWCFDFPNLDSQYYTPYPKDINVYKIIELFAANENKNPKNIGNHISEWKSPIPFLKEKNQLNNLYHLVSIGTHQGKTKITIPDTVLECLKEINPNFMKADKELLLKIENNKIVIEDFWKYE